MFYAFPQNVWSLGLSVFNPIKAGESESMYSLESMYRVEMHVHSPIFQGQLIEKKLDR